MKQRRAIVRAVFLLPPPVVFLFVETTFFYGHFFKTICGVQFVRSHAPYTYLL